MSVTANGYRPSRRLWLRVGLLMLLYVVTGSVGLTISPVNAFATLVWPPTGIALAAILLFGYRLWPGIAAGALLVNLWVGAPFLVACTIAAGNTLEAVLSAALLHRVAKFHPSLGRVRDILSLVGVIGFVGAPVSATIGVMALSAAGVTAASAIGPTWRAWWIGDLLGALIVAPLLLAWRAKPSFSPFRLGRAVEAVLLGVSVVGAGLVVFGGSFGTSHANTPIAYLVLPPLMWAALRFGLRGAVTSTATLSLLATWGSLEGFGLFAGGTFSERLMWLQVFMGLTAVTVMILAAAVAERLHAMLLAQERGEALRKANEDLERRVQERTNTLAQANEQLQQEIAGRQRMEQAVRASEGRFRAVVETARDAIVSAGWDGNIIAWNRGAEAIFGYREEEILGKPLTVLMPPRFREAHSEGIRRFTATGQSRLIGKTIELAGLRKDGTEFPLELSLSTWTTPEGSFVTAIIRDITQRKQAEEQLNETNQLLIGQRSELLDALLSAKKAHEELQATQLQLIQAAKFESVGRLAAGVAHEVKNPLATLLIGLDHLADHYPHEDPDIRLLLGDMAQAVRRADTVIRGLLDFSSPRKLEVTMEELPAVLEGALILLKHDLDRHRVTVAREFQDEMPPIPLDRNKIEQVFINLFMNASEAMPGGGTLTVRTFIKEARSPGPQRRRRRGDVLRPEGRLVVVEVDDTGSGIPKEKLARIFDPFFTTKRTGQGTGLGLTVSQKIVELHGGTLEVQNRKEGGVRATVTFHAGTGRHRLPAGTAIAGAAGA